MARVDHACDDIEADDFLEPFNELVLPVADAAQPPPDFSERVPILPGLAGRELMGDGDSFSIARGTDHVDAVSTTDVAVARRTGAQD